jgi:hypothetical protein
MIEKDIKETAKAEWKANKSVLKNDYKFNNFKEWLDGALSLEVESYDEYQSINWSAGYLYGLQQALRFINQLQVEKK